MARLKSNILGNLSGRLGNLSARIIDGITHFVSRPSVFKINRSPKAEAARKKFAVTVNFITGILSVPELKYVWQKAGIKGKYLRSSMFKLNYHFFEGGSPTLLNIITPSGFTPAVKGLTISEDNIDIELNPLNSLSNFLSVEVNLQIVLMTAFFNPINKFKERLKVECMTKEINGFNFNMPYTFSFEIIDAVKAVSALYENSIIYLAAITKNAAGKIVKCSSTYAREVQL